MQILKLTEAHLEACVDLYIDVFTRAPWNDVYDSREQVVSLFKNFLANNYFVGFVLTEQAQIIALSIGFKKPWIKGLEYYIDQFCVAPDWQNKGVGSRFLSLIEQEIQQEGMHALMLNTERGFPSERFYLKNGFQEAEGYVVLVKECPRA